MQSWCWDNYAFYRPYWNESLPGWNRLLHHLLPNKCDWNIAHRRGLSMPLGVLVRFKTDYKQPYHSMKRGLSVSSKTFNGNWNREINLVHYRSSVSSQTLEKRCVAIFKRSPAFFYTRKSRWLGNSTKGKRIKWKSIRRKSGITRLYGNRSKRDK